MQRRPLSTLILALLLLTSVSLMVLVLPFVSASDGNDDGEDHHHHHSTLDISALISGEGDDAVDPNKLCTSNDNGGFDCCLHVDRKIRNEHLNFTLCLHMHTNMTERSAEVIVKYDDKVLYDKKVMLSQLSIPICMPLPVASSLGIKLCAIFSDIRFSHERNCFSAAVAVDLKVLFVGKIHLLKPMPFGYNTERCREVPTLVTYMKHQQLRRARENRI